MRLLVTGGAGFIGINFVRELLDREPGVSVVVLDNLTYAADRRALREHPRMTFVVGDIADRELVRDILARTRPTAIVHLAAETHVDRSIDAPAKFIATNVTGTLHLLEECRRYLDAAPPGFRFVHVSTDEVFGALGESGSFDETSRYAPRSPYAASKASSDHLVAAYAHTYGLPTITTNCTNNYGPHQHPEKLIPRMITNALAGKPLPVYGRGQQIRDWIHVTDHCAALRAVVAHGKPGEVYLVGARNERANIDVVHAICDVLDALRPRSRSHRELVALVADRPGHDFRYAIDPSKIERELGWRPVVELAAGIARTVAWYVEHYPCASS
jgi:dTDP-glucose 4,6-dehydratase